MDNAVLRRQILEALEFDPSIDAEAITVSVSDGFACLGGRVPSSEQKTAAVAVASKLQGVRAVADEIEVRFTPRQEAKDEDIARQVAALLDHAMGAQASRIRITVSGGWVTLAGEVDSYFLPRTIEEEVRRLSDVEGLSNRINVRTDPRTEAVMAQIRNVFQRDLFMAPGELEVRVYGGTATLKGSVHSDAERNLAVKAAASIDGINFVDDKLEVVGA